MNKDKLKKLLYHRVRIRPISTRNDGNNQLETIDDVWIIQSVKETVKLSNIRTGHVAILGLDHIHHYVSDPKEEYDELKNGFLMLNIQVTLSGNKLEIEPIKKG